MRQEQIEKLIDESFKEKNVAFFYEYYKEYGHCKQAMLNAIHRATQVPKFQIVTYLNKKGFDYATADREGNNS